MDFSGISLTIVIKFSLVEKNKRKHDEVLKHESMEVRLGQSHYCHILAK